MRRGDSVEWFSASFPGAPSEETLDGIRIVRGGRQWSVHWAAFQRYRRNLAVNFDIVVDEVNTIPFFTPLWSDVPSVMFIHQLAREVWWYESKFPVNVIGYAAEPRYLGVYCDSPVMTVSASTRDDLRRLGFKGSITIIPEGIELMPDMPMSRPAEPNFLYVGRLAPSKRIEHIVRALALFRKATGHGTLCLAGSGPDQYQRALARLARRVNVDQSVTFCGRVTPLEKHRLMNEASALLMTSVREGWGLVVSEANSCGTPAIVYDVAGLRDSVRNEVTGLVVPPDQLNLCKAMMRLVSDENLYTRLATEARRWANGLSFDESARVVESALERALVTSRSGRSVVAPH